MREVTMAEFNAKFEDLIEAAISRGERIILTRDGVPVLMLKPIGPENEADDE